MCGNKKFNYISHYGFYGRCYSSCCYDGTLYGYSMTEWNVVGANNSDGLRYIHLTLRSKMKGKKYETKTIKVFDIRKNWIRSATFLCLHFIFSVPILSFSDLQRKIFK